MAVPSALLKKAGRGWDGYLDWRWLLEEYCGAIREYLVTLRIKTLPIVEKWDRHNCGNCCRGVIIPLDDKDLQRLRAQRWDDHPDFHGQEVVVRSGFLSKSHRLAHRQDGSCVFLTSEGLCRIHQEHGMAAKPLVCQMYPLQLVPLESFAYLTLRRSCPSAAAGQGRELEVHWAGAIKLCEQRQLAPRAVVPPNILPGIRRTWKDALQVLEGIERLMVDGRYPLVRRLVHGLQFCDLLGASRLRRLDSQQLGELVSMLEEAAKEVPKELFQDRQPPGRSAGAIMRQTVLEYVRLLPQYHVKESWAERWRLVRAAIAMHRGRGSVPRLHASFPEATFESLELPLGALNSAILDPLCAFYESSATSKQYAVAVRPGWSIVDNFRALALTYATGLWLLRYCASGREPAVHDAIDVVTAIDRGQGYAPLGGWRHRRRIGALSEQGTLARIIAWHAR